MLYRNDCTDPAGLWCTSFPRLTLHCIWRKLGCLQKQRYFPLELLSQTLFWPWHITITECNKQEDSHQSVINNTWRHCCQQSTDDHFLLISLSILLYNTMLSLARVSTPCWSTCINCDLLSSSSSSLSLYLAKGINPYATGGHVPQYLWRKGRPW